MIRELAAAIARWFGGKRTTRPSAPPPHVPPACCRKSVHGSPWSWPDCTEPFCNCQDASMVESDLPPIKHRDLYADRFDLEE